MFNCEGIDSTFEIFCPEVYSSQNCYCLGAVYFNTSQFWTTISTTQILRINVSNKKKVLRELFTGKFHLLEGFTATTRRKSATGTLFYRPVSIKVWVDHEAIWWFWPGNPYHLSFLIFMVCNIKVHVFNFQSWTGHKK